MILAIGDAAQSLDIFLRDPVTGLLSDPSTISYVIKEPSGTSVATGTGFKRSVGHYDARNSTIPSGFILTSPWTITWTFTSVAGITSVVSENFTVVAALSTSFADVDNIIEFARLDTGTTTSDFTDAQMVTFIKKALIRTNRRLRLVGTTKAFSFNSVTGAIQPTPNDVFLDLILMQVECFMIKNLSRGAVSKGIRIKDGDAEIDTSASLGGWANITRDFCDDLDDAFDRLLAQMALTGCPGDANDNGAGQLVVYSTSRIREVMGHAGQGGGHIRCRVSPFEVDLPNSPGISRNP